MGIPILDKFPAVIQAGDTLSLLISLANFPAPTWSLTLTLIIPGGSGAPITIGPSTPNGSNHSLAVPATTTAGWVAGSYACQCKATDGTNVATVDRGTTTILPALAANVDPRTHEEKCLAAVTAVIEGRIDDPITEYRIGEREAKRIPMFELLKLRAYYQVAVRRQKGGSPFRLIPTEFQNPRFTVAEPGETRFPFA